VRDHDDRVLRRDAAAIKKPYHTRAYVNEMIEQELVTSRKPGRVKKKAGPKVTADALAAAQGLKRTGRQ